jgi:hypothetical protein
MCTTLADYLSAVSVMLGAPMSVSEREAVRHCFLSIWKHKGAIP